MKFENVDPALLAKYLSALISPKEQPSNLATLINNTLYKFNKNKLEEMLQHPQFAFLLIEFLNDQKAMRAIFRNAKSPQHRAFYQSMIDLMKKRCLKSLEGS